MNEPQKRGIILALKNIGTYLATFTVTGIKADFSQFMFAFMVYILINTPSDLILLNHWSTEDKKEGAKT